MPFSRLVEPSSGQPGDEAVADRDDQARGAVKGTRRAKRQGLLDHLVGVTEQRERNGYAERFGGLEVHHQPEHGRPLDRQFAGLWPFRILST